MASHAAPRRRRSIGEFIRSRRTRAVLSLGILLGFGSVSTMAFWTDNAQMDTGSFQSGRLDVALDGNLTGPGGTWANTAIAAPTLVPGESVAYRVQVQNAGTTALTYTATATASGALATGEGLTPVPAASERLQFAVHVSSTESNSGTTAASNRVGACTGTAVYSGTLGGSSSAVIPSAQTLATSGSQNVCIRVSLPTAAVNNLQNRTASASFIFNAKQVGAP